MPMGSNTVKSLITGIAIGISAGNFGAVYAQEQAFEATCVNADKCTVRATGEFIETSKGLTIKADDILIWSMSNNSEKKSLGWCFWTGVKCYNKDDYRFMIKYYDKDGNRQITQIGFFNEKPAQAFASFLTALSGLEAGIENVKNSNRRSSAMDPNSTPAFTDSTTSPLAKPKTSKDLGNPKGSTPILQTP